MLTDDEALTMVLQIASGIHRLHKVRVCVSAPVFIPSQGA
jgi:hypothetical protein